MQIETKGRLAVVAMLELALLGERSLATLASISMRRRISLSYLELLFARLREHGLVRSARGPGGGYGLSRKATEITMAEIVRAVDGPQVLPEQYGADPGPAAPGQRVRSDWHQDLERVMMDHLASVSLQDLAESARREANVSVAALSGASRVAAPHPS